MEKHYKQVEFKELICPSCGNVFLGKGRTKYCSLSCKRIAQKKRNQKKIGEKRCPKCGIVKLLIYFYKGMEATK